MKRIILMVLRLFYRVPGFFLNLIRMAKPDYGTDADRIAYLNKNAADVNRKGRVTVKAVGVENVPKEENFLYAPNHQGLYDVLAFLETSPRFFGVVMKKEVADIILIKQFRKATDSLPIDREDMRAGVRTIQEMGRLIKEKHPFLVFAEGTRSKRGNITGEFKGGAFRGAQIAQCPIVPVAMIDSFRPFDEGHTRPVTMEIHYLPPIPYEEFKDLKTGKIAEMVKTRIDDEIRRTLAERGETLPEDPAAEAGPQEKA